MNWLDYGARWYDGASGRWGQVDPLAEEYYSISSFVFAANNPQFFIDPDGRRIVVNGQEWEKGAKYKGEDEFGHAVFNTLNMVANAGAQGEKWLNELAISAFEFSIVELKGDEASYFEADNPDYLDNGTWVSGEPGGGTVYWNHNDMSRPKITEDGLESDPEMILVHELIGHGTDANEGTSDANYQEGESIVSNREASACYRENVVRSEVKRPLRVYYGISSDRTKGYGRLIKWDKQDKVMRDPYSGRVITPGKRKDRKN